MMKALSQLKIGDIIELNERYLSVVNDEEAAELLSCIESEKVLVVSSVSTDDQMCWIKGYDSYISFEWINAVLEKDSALVDEIVADIQRHFKAFFTEYQVPEAWIEEATEDVLLSSGIKDEGQYNDSDISMACQRVLLNLIKD